MEAVVVYFFSYFHEIKLNFDMLPYYRVRQATGFTGKDFHPTSNARCQAMVKEAGDFAAHLKKCEKAIADMKAAAESILTTTKSAMSAPLPRVYAETAAASGGAVQPIESIGGPGFQGDTVARLSQTCSAELESQVLVPIKRWLEVHLALQSRLKEVEALRLEVDSRRHTVITLAADVDRLRAKLSKVNGADGKLEGTLDDTIKKLQHKEGKLSMTVANFTDKEKLLHEDLSTLIKDAAWLRHYMASALRVQGETLLSASSALGDTQAAEPAVNMASVSVDTSPAGGAVGSRDQAKSGTTSRQSQVSQSTDGSGAAAQGMTSSVGGQTKDHVEYDSNTVSPQNPFLASGVLH